MKALSRIVMGAVAMAVLAGAFTGDAAYAGSKKSSKPKKDSTASCAAGFAKALPEAVKKAQKKGGDSIVPVVTGAFEGYVKFTTKDRRGKKKTEYYKVKCGEIKGPYSSY